MVGAIHTVGQSSESCCSVSMISVSVRWSMDTVDSTQQDYGWRDINRILDPSSGSRLMGGITQTTLTQDVRKIQEIQDTTQ